MLWLALYCPTLPLDCILRRWPEGLDPALAVTDLDGARRLIMVATRKAQSFGVVAGQSIATAVSLLPDLVLVSRKLEDERSALAEAALAALRFTPTVSLRPSGLVMEIASSLKLFGGRRALKQSLAAAMRVQGLAICAAEGPTPHGAWLLAQDRARQRMRDERRPPIPPTAASPAIDDKLSAPRTFATALDALPIGHLETAQPSMSRLEGIGVRTLADLRRLPAQGLARRFGPELIDELARAFGDKPDPQTVFTAPSRFDLRIELMAQVETAEALIFASQRLLAQMTGWLVARRAAVRGFTLILHHDRWKRDAVEPTSIAIALSTPSSDLSRLGTLVRERMAHFELKAPVHELSLAAPAIVEEQESHGVLFPTQEQAVETLARLFEKLTVRLGPETMMRIERVADHRPERSWREVSGHLPYSTTTNRSPGRIHRSKAAIIKNQVLNSNSLALNLFDIQTATPTEPTSQPGTWCGPHPSWLLIEPMPLETLADRPIFEEIPLQLVAGPERIEAGWWDTISTTRDYFIGENSAGRLVWVYRERFAIAERPFWYLHGLFG